MDKCARCQRELEPEQPRFAHRVVVCVMDGVDEEYFTLCTGCAAGARVFMSGGGIVAARAQEPSRVEPVVISHSRFSPSDMDEFNRRNARSCPQCGAIEPCASPSCALRRT